jgi:hypothetical protein
MSRSHAVDFDDQFAPPEAGGGGGFGQTYFEVHVAITSDHNATLTRTPFERSKSP